MCYTEQYMTRRAIAHFFIEFIPTFTFFVASQLYDFYTATAIFMVSALLTFIIGWIYEKHLPILPVIVLLFILVSGSITLMYQQPDAVIISNTIYYILFGGLLLCGKVINFNILKKIFRGTFAITDYAWDLLTIRWGLFLILIGLGNEYMRLTQTDEAWVEYKFYTTIIISIFALLQLRLSKQYRIASHSNKWGIRTKDDDERG